MKRGDSTFDVFARACEIVCLFRQRVRLERIRLNEGMCPFRQFERFRPRSESHMLRLYQAKGSLLIQRRLASTKERSPMDGNKPPTTFVSAFTQRVAMHPEVAYYPYPDTLCHALVTFMIDQLLVGEAVLQNSVVKAALELHADDTGTFVFDEGDPPNENVAIWRLKNVTGAGSLPDVAQFVWDFRVLLASHGIAPEQVAPNHVVIPAPNFHDCPFGPPSEHDQVVLEPAMPSAVNVAVIDAGYLALGPIATRVATVGFGKWLKRNPPGSPKPWDWADGDEVVPGAPSPLDQNGDFFLDALTGHANFVAGVIAQVCPEARITVESHNASFVESDAGNPAISTEASVSRSLWNQRANDVINVGFAFPTLPDISLVGDEAITAGPSSWSLNVALTSFADRDAHFVVAPAGNQDCTVPQYPAAFSLTHPNVIGVGSIDGNGGRSSFSNHGPWVSCCTEGENVTSTFITGWDGKTEEEEPPGLLVGTGTRVDKNFQSGWATWNGTSFAAPKIAAQLAVGKAGKETLPARWTHLAAGGVTVPELDMGVSLRELPPN